MNEHVKYSRRPQHILRQVKRIMPLKSRDNNIALSEQLRLNLGLIHICKISFKQSICLNKTKCWIFVAVYA